jgi:hypothetical protein
VLFSELNQRMGTDNPMLDAVRDHAVFITNSPSAKLLAKKASLAFLSDERNRDLFTAEHHAFINAHIPWDARHRRAVKTLYRDQSVDLLAFVSRPSVNALSRSPTMNTGVKAWCWVGKQPMKNGQAPYKPRYMIRMSFKNGWMACNATSPP